VAATPKRPIILRSLAREIDAASGKYFQFEKSALDVLSNEVVSDALQYLAEDDIGQGETSSAKLRLKPVRLGVAGTVQVVDPHGAVDDDHDLFRDAIEPRRVQIAFPRDLATETANTSLALGLNQQAQSFFYHSPLRTGSAASHRLTHQPIIDVNVRSHV
jgi:hypothetical protein